MLVGYVSDENYVAIADASVEIVDPSSDNPPVRVRSSASGRVDADLEPGTYQVVLAAAGYPGKRETVHLGAAPVQFRLLSAAPYGFVWPKYSFTGDRADLCVSSPHPYRLSLWRYGRDREFVADLGFGEHEVGATAALLPDGDVSLLGVDWIARGFPGQATTAPARGGLYYVHVHTEPPARATTRPGEAGQFTCFPWIVAPSRPSSPIAVLLPDLTWNAYNAFGGRSNYLFPAGLPAAPAINRRQDLPRYVTPDANDWEADRYPPVSFRRPDPDNAIPLDEQVDGPITTRAGAHLAAAEWRLLSWLERDGWDYDVYAESQLHHGQVPLDAYRAVILGCHPEYWSWPMFEAVRAWVLERSGRLMYLGGNGLNCEVELGPDDTMLVHNGDVRKLGPMTGPDWSRFAARRVPEASLLGVGYDPRGLLTAAPYEVVAADHWAFAGTGVAAGDIFGDRSYNTRIRGGASGHETDKLSPHSPPGTTLLAHGRNDDGGGADIVHVRHDGGGEVFSVGSIAFTSALLVDPVVSSLTANVLRRFVRGTP